MTDQPTAHELERRAKRLARKGRGAEVDALAAETLARKAAEARIADLQDVLERVTDTLVAGDADSLPFDWTVSLVAHARMTQIAKSARTVVTQAETLKLLAAEVDRLENEAEQLEEVARVVTADLRDQIHKLEAQLAERADLERQLASRDRQLAKLLKQRGGVV